LTTALKRAIKRVDPETKRKYLDLLADALIAQAIDGNCRASAAAMREIWARLDGPTRQELDVTSAGNAVGYVALLGEMTDAELHDLAFGARGDDSEEAPDSSE
jgi:hypothetical protein